MAANPRRDATRTKGIARRIGQRVEVTWGPSRGVEGEIFEIYPTGPSRGMVAVKYRAKVAQPLSGIEPGEMVHVLVHWRNTLPLDRPKRR